MNILITGGSGFVGSSLQHFYRNNSHEHKYNIYAPSHEDVDLLKLDQIQRYIEQHEIEYVIHAACIGARRYARNAIDDVYTNLLMFENLVVASKNCIKLISFGSGGEYDISTNITENREEDISSTVPLEYGGFLKSIIAKRILTITKNPQCFNARFFGSFGPLEDDDRFIKGNLLRVMRKEPIIIHQNRWFDFVYIDDLIRIVTYMLHTNCPTDMNCVYVQKYTLLDIAHIINQITESKSAIIIEQDDIGLSYTGDGTLLQQLGLQLTGLKNGIQQTYEKLLCVP